MFKERIKSFWEQNPCGTKNIPYEVGTREFFDEVEKKRYVYEPWILQAVDFPKWRGKKVLEIGCGMGTDFLQFAKNGADAYAVDLTEKAVDLTRKRLTMYGFSPTQERIRTADAEHLPFEDNSFDFVYSWGVLHHTPNTRATIEEVYRVLKPGTETVIMLYHKFSWTVLKLLLFYGVARGELLTRTPLEVISAHTEATGNALTQVFSRGEIRNMFSKFSNVSIRPVLTTADRKFIPKFLQWFLFPSFGFFLIISGGKSPQYENRHGV